MTEGITVTMRGADGPGPIRAMHSLRYGDLGRLATLMAKLPGAQFPGAWSLECHDGYEGDLTALLGPRQGASHESSARFVVSRTREGFHLALNQEDAYEKLGTFDSLDTLFRVIEAGLPLSVPAPPPHDSVAPGRLRRNMGVHLTVLVSAV